MYRHILYVEYVLQKLQTITELSKIRLKFYQSGVAIYEVYKQLFSS